MSKTLEEWEVELSPKCCQWQQELWTIEFWPREGYSNGCFHITTLDDYLRHQAGFLARSLVGEYGGSVTYLLAVVPKNLVDETVRRYKLALAEYMNPMIYGAAEE